MPHPDPSGLTFVALDPAHAPAAAALVAARVRALRAGVPDLPEAWTDATAFARLVAELAIRGTGAAALRDGRLVGFQAASLLDGHGGRWSYTPDFGHAITDDADGRVVEGLYARLAEGWAASACLEHVVTVLEGDVVTMSALARLGFGHTVVDLVRNLSAVEACVHVAGVEVRRAGPADAAAIGDLDLGLRRHLAASPIFLRMSPARSPELYRRGLAGPAEATFLAEADGAAIAFLRIGPSATDVATIVRDPGTASITGAFTVADRRGDGVASCLLDAAIGWAREAGYARCAVDHESANGEASRFWARHFMPVAVSVTRRLSPRPAP